MIRVEVPSTAEEDGSWLHSYMVRFAGKNLPLRALSEDRNIEPRVHRHFYGVSPGITTSMYHQAQRIIVPLVFPPWTFVSRSRQSRPNPGTSLSSSLVFSIDRDCRKAGRGACRASWTVRVGRVSLGSERHTGETVGEGEREWNRCLLRPCFASEQHGRGGTRTHVDRTAVRRTSERETARASGGRQVTQRDATEQIGPGTQGRRGPVFARKDLVSVS